jgi:wyosine [tRNA(Phe)-imidazoG37] synthetase (radical SAM superfamily)
VKYVFGPVPSRRLGQSLGIDNIPLKTCNWNCVYCQLGRTRPVTNTRQEYFPTHEIIAEVEKTLQTLNHEDIDWITFVGSGEPTLHSKIGELIRAVKVLSKLPVAVITNGALLYQPSVREELSAADAVLPSLDAGNQQLYRKINRPHPEINYSRLLDGLIQFRREYKGKLWIEVMLVHGLNDSETALKEIAASINQIKPDEVHVVQPTRPPVESWVKPPDEDALSLAHTILGVNAKVVSQAGGHFNIGNQDLQEDSIIGIISRHPMAKTDLIKALDSFPSEVINKTLDKLIIEQKIQIIERYNTEFVVPGSAFYPSEIQNKTVKPDMSAGQDDPV